MPETITDLPIRVCRVCMATWMEDPQMYDEVDRCPHCGTYAGSGDNSDYNEDYDV